MEVTRSDAVRISHASAVSEVRRLVAHHAAALGWNEEAEGAARVIATELATNIAKHAREGIVVVNSGFDGKSLQLVAMDRGPGMADLARCLEDGYSTAGSPGTGFGAARRMSSTFDVLTTPGKGTLVAAGYAPGWKGAQPGNLQLGVVCVPREGEQVCGDTWAARREGDRLVVLVCDGLGHGALAAEAAKLARDSFMASVLVEPKPLMQLMHEALKPSRGAAVAVASVDLRTGALTFCGVGNVTGVVVSGDETRHLVSHNGIVGHRASRIAEFSATCPPGSALVLHSDGVSARWRPAEWNGLWQRDPTLIASALWRDHGRGTDDATVLVARVR
jgi:anti-sigma regulatory factor (Ser/Thr protein kinase)